MAAAVALVVLGATWGAGVFGALTSGGFVDDSSKSAQVRARITQAFGPQDADVLVIYSSPTESATDPAVQSAVTAALTKVRSEPEVASEIGRAHV